MGLLNRMQVVNSMSQYSQNQHSSMHQFYGTRQKIFFSLADHDHTRKNKINTCSSAKRNLTIRDRKNLKI